MSRCVGCRLPISRTELLCYRCFDEDLRVRWPTCTKCYLQEARCGESGYRLCYSCHHAHLRWLNQMAEPIQILVRGFLARRLLKKHKAAKQIQAVWRGHLTRLQTVIQA